MTPIYIYYIYIYWSYWTWWSFSEQSVKLPEASLKEWFLWWLDDCSEYEYEKMSFHPNCRQRHSRSHCHPCRQAWSPAANGLDREEKISLLLLSGNTTVENGWQLPIYRWIIYITLIYHDLPIKKWWFSISYVTFPEGKFEVGQVVAFSTTLRSTHFMARHATYDHIPCCAWHPRLSLNVI